MPNRPEDPLPLVYGHATTLDGGKYVVGVDVRGTMSLPAALRPLEEPCLNLPVSVTIPVQYLRPF